MTQYSALVVWQPLINTSFADARVPITRPYDSATSGSIGGGDIGQVCRVLGVHTNRVGVQTSYDDLFVCASREHYLSYISAVFVLPLSSRWLSDGQFPYGSRQLRCPTANVLGLDECKPSGIRKPYHVWSTYSVHTMLFDCMVWSDVKDNVIAVHWGGMTLVSMLSGNDDAVSNTYQFAPIQQETMALACNIFNGKRLLQVNSFFQVVKCLCIWVHYNLGDCSLTYLALKFENRKIIILTGT
jgi:hypothetical protein